MKFKPPGLFQRILLRIRSLFDPFEYNRTSKIIEKYGKILNEKIWMNGYEIEFEDGEKYKFTGNHKLLTSNRGWVRTDNLLETDNVISF